MRLSKFLNIMLAVIFTVSLLAGCNVNVNQEEPVKNDPIAEATPLPSLTGEQQSGGQQGGPVDAPKVEGIQYDAKYRKDLNIDPEQFAGKTLTIWVFWDVTDEDGTIASFEKATGAKVNHVNKTYESYSSDLIKAIAAGEGPDICYFGSEAIPAYVMKGYLTPVSDYLDFSKVQFATSQSIEDFFTFNGKLYVMPDTGPSSSKLYFRKDIFANASLPNPYELWQAGEWTWDRFVKLAQDVKQDVDGDGEYDIWGYYSWQSEQILYSNGGNYVIWKDGEPVEGLSDPKTIRAMEWERALSEQFEIIAPWDPDSDPPGMLTKGSIAMMYWGDWLLEGLREELGDKLGIAPFPKGPDATNPMGDAAAATKEGIAGYCKEPELAALYLLYKRLPFDEADEVKAKTKDDEQNIKLYGSLDEYEMCLEMANYAVINPCSGFTGLWNVVDAIRNKDDMTPAQAIETYKHVAQKKIDETWKP